MGNRYPISTHYFFCSNCEDEVPGFPAGERIPSGRPLCVRCTQIGLEEGWATSEELKPDQRIHAPRGRVFGGLLILALIFFTAIALFAATAVFGPHGRR